VQSVDVAIHAVRRELAARVLAGVLRGAVVVAVAAGAERLEADRVGGDGAGEEGAGLVVQADLGDLRARKMLGWPRRRRLAHAVPVGMQL
jgi:hypothetical protein